MTELVGTLVRNEDGTMRWAPWEPTPPEAVCPVCRKEIQWCLDMFSFNTGFDETHPFALVHAHCGWRCEVFVREAMLALALAPVRAQASEEKETKARQIREFKAATQKQEDQA